MKILADRFLPIGHMVLMKKGRPVWSGKIGTLLYNIDSDTVVVNPADYEKLTIDSEKLDKSK